MCLHLRLLGNLGFFFSYFLWNVSYPFPITSTGSYTVTQSDINSGRTITNNATARFTQVKQLTNYNNNEISNNNNNEQVPNGHSAQSSTQSTGTPSLRVTKTADRTQVDAANQVITYTIEVANTGNVDLANCTLSDAR
jgi:hypothetical protein